MANKIITKDKPASNVAEMPENTSDVFKLKIDKGTQKLYIHDHEEYGLFEEVTFRPLEVFTKIVAYNDDFEVKSESTQFRELAEARDSTGSKASDQYKDGKGSEICGRLVWKRITDTLTKEQQDANKKKAKYYQILYGIVTVAGHGPILADFRIGGAKFMEVANLLKQIKADKKEYYKAEVRIKTFPNKEIDWPELEFMADYSRELPVTGLDTILETIEANVERHNASVDKKAKERLEKKEASAAGPFAKTGYKKYKN